MSEDQYFPNDQAYINHLEEELESWKKSFAVIARAVDTSQQCIIRWDWDRTYEFPEGRTRPVKLHELIKEAINQKYKIITIVIDEYDDTGSALHATIVALTVFDGKLH